MATTTAQFDPLLDEAPSRFVVGIDLGTTNSAVTYVDTEQSPWSVRVFEVAQFVAAGEIEARDTLPSFHYQAAEGESGKGAPRLPWQSKPSRFSVGVYARDQGVSAPGRLIASAKSWLCHAGVDRTAEILPWQGAADVDRLSPVDVSARYLQHIREAWDASFPQFPLADQDIVLTLPASFDEVARELTVEAAKRAGLPRVVLIEEPQAAFYAWVYRNSESWETQVEPGQKILVCDIGGGTSDFTLIRVRKSASENKVQFHRVAVGDHLILGGDNLDLALARYVEKKLTEGGKLEPRQWDVLVRSCRGVKETLLGENAPEKVTVNLPGSGTKLIGGSLRAEVTRSEVLETLVDGFFPEADLDAQPTRHASGFQEFGLPYAADPGVTRYLASFLTTHRHTGSDDVEATTEHDPARPDIVLFNGGLLESSAIRERLIERLTTWFAGATDWQPKILENRRLFLAVAEGAAYYGMVRRGEGVKITASLARSYYIGVQTEKPTAVCLMPGSAEPGASIDLSERTFQLAISEPVEFPFYFSSTRLTDQPGEIIPLDEEQMRTLPPIRTVLKTQRKSERGEIDVQLHAKLTEIGTLDVWCTEAEGERSWRLQLDVRSTTQTDLAAHESAAETQGIFDEKQWAAIRELLVETFGDKGDGSPEKLMKRLTAAAGARKHEWPTSMLRRIWETLMELEPGRGLSPKHESRWLNLLGYSLRPGYGLAVDDWRVAETWRLVQGKLRHRSAASRTESLILWRRIAGGLSAGQQRAVAEPLIAPVRSFYRKFTGGKSGDLMFQPHESNEIWRLLGSLELLPGELKIELGKMLVELLGKKKKLAPVRPAIVWAIGRIGQRAPAYGPLNTVVPVVHVTPWLSKLVTLRDADDATHLAVMQLARRTDDRYRDVSADDQAAAIAFLEDQNAPAHYIDLVRDAGELDRSEQGKVFGESLPKGLRL